MEFDKSKVYTALNADESLIGAKGYFANDIETLKYKVSNTESIQHYKETFCERLVSDIDDGYNFFYLVEPPEKWYVYDNGFNGYTICKSKLVGMLFGGTKEECEQFISEYSKPKYRPFKDCDELIKTYHIKLMEKYKTSVDFTDIELPSIWVKAKSDGRKDLITSFNDEEKSVNIDGIQNDFNELLKYYTFLDGSVCGVEE